MRALRARILLPVASTSGPICWTGSRSHADDLFALPFDAYSLIEMRVIGTDILAEFERPAMFSGLHGAEDCPHAETADKAIFILMAQFRHVTSP